MTNEVDEVIKEIVTTKKCILNKHASKKLIQLIEYFPDEFNSLKGDIKSLIINYEDQFDEIVRPLKTKFEYSKAIQLWGKKDKFIVEYEGDKITIGTKFIRVDDKYSQLPDGRYKTDLSYPYIQTELIYKNGLVYAYRFWGVI